MQWIVGYELELCLVVIYIGYQSIVDYLQWDVESTSKLDYKGVSNPMGPIGPLFKFIYHNDMVYEGWIGSMFTLMHKVVLVIMQGCTRGQKQILKIGLID